jgi:DNA-binding CsgD family transcriptional regulator
MTGDGTLAGGMNTARVIIGREAELAKLVGFISTIGEARALVLTGSPGIGKTTLLDAAVEEACERHMHVLTARPAEPESPLSYSALADLLETLDALEPSSLPAPQLHALDVVLLRADPHGAPPAPRAVYAALLNVLRALAARERVIIAVDDIQWLDEATAQALAFVARRLATANVRFLLAKRDVQSPVLERAFPPAELRRVELGALSFGAIREVLSLRLGTLLPRRVIRRVVEASGGNPLFALELGRLLVERGLPRAEEELPLPRPVEDLVGDRFMRLSPGVRRLLLAVALCPNLRWPQLLSLGEPAAAEEVVAAGLLVKDNDRVRITHPTLAAAARQRGMHERLSMHLELADIVDNEELRAHHLALGSEVPNDHTAARLSSAASRAASRGAVVDASALAAHALRLTPPASAARSDRVLALAERLVVVGDHTRVSELLTSELDAMTEARSRARAHQLLAVTTFALSHVDDAGARLRKALDESADDPALHARAMAGWSGHLSVGEVARIDEAERCALEVLPDARRAGPDVECEVLYALALARKLRGRSFEHLQARFQQVSAGALSIQAGVERLAADRLVVRGLVDEARIAFTRLLTLADTRGEDFSYLWLLQQSCELELRAGCWDAAERLLEDWEGSPDRQVLDDRAYQRCRALLAAGRGTGDAKHLADRVIEACEAKGMRWNLLEALRARGLAVLLAGDTLSAAESFSAVWQHNQREGVDEPGEFPVAADLVEALVALDQLEDAAAVAKRLRGLAEEQEHPWGCITATRCEALLALASGRDEGALQDLVRASADYEARGLHFDHARTLLSAGRAARRLNKRRLARDLLGQAVGAFEEIGSPGWADAARVELDGISGRRRSSAAVLTAAEQRAAVLAARGRSNKEIAAELYVSVPTVESHLSHAYAKLGIRSRGQLRQRMSELDGEG